MLLSYYPSWFMTDLFPIQSANGSNCQRQLLCGFPILTSFLVILSIPGVITAWHIHAAAAAKSLQLCLTVQPHRRQPIRLRHPWDSSGKNTGVGCHFLLQCRKVKSESEVAQSCPTLRDPMDYSLPGSSIHGIFQARGLEWTAIAFSTHTC